MPTRLCETKAVLRRKPGTTGETITCPLCGEQVPMRETPAGTTAAALRHRDPAVIAGFAYIVLGHECRG